MKDKKYLAKIDALIAAQPQQVVVPIYANLRGKVPERVNLATQYLATKGYRLTETETQTLGSARSFGHMVFERTEPMD